MYSSIGHHAGLINITPVEQEKLPKGVGELGWGWQQKQTKRGAGEGRKGVGVAHAGWS